MQTRNRSLVAVTLAVALASLAAPAFAQSPAPSASGDSFVSIFNGQDLKGWDGTPELWSVQNGVIVGQTSDANPLPYNKFLIWKDGELEDFELKLEFRIDGGNSGIQFRSVLREGKDGEGKPLLHSVSGYQADFDAGRAWTGSCYGEGFGGVLAKRGEKVVLKAPEAIQAAAGKPAKPGQLNRDVSAIGDYNALKELIRDKEWNEFRIIAQGNHIQQFVNGTLMVDVTDQRPEARSKGILALQLHRGPAMKVEFRNLQLKKLCAACTPAKQG